MEALLSVNCAVHHRPESRNETTTLCKCYSTKCMMNTNSDIAKRIQEEGCTIYQQKFVQDVVAKNPKLRALPESNEQQSNQQTEK